jgi:hypothetical protein
MFGLCAAATASADTYKAGCDSVDDASDISMAARYIQNRNRALFSVSFKAPAGTSYGAGTSLPVVVDGITVGTIPLGPRAGGAAGGSISFNSYANQGISAGNYEVTPFPSSWPSLRSHPKVEVASLGCALRAY